jgi:CTP:molybdopterin cytidylyltransferase MocA
MSRKIVGLVLAAGRSERASFPKALGILDGETLVERAIRTLGAAGVAKVIVVVAAPHGDRIRQLTSVDSVENPEPERGMLSSLSLGMRAALVHLPELVVFGLVDHPHVRPETIRRLCELAADSDGARPKLGERTGHPVVVTREVAEALANADLALTARDVLGRFRIADVEVEDPAVLEDLDTGAELAQAGVLPQ